MLFQFGHYTLDDREEVVRCDERPLKLERRAFRLLTYLIRNRERIVPKEELIDVLWNGDAVSESSLPRCVSELRSALGNRDRSDTGIIETVYGHGYRFKPTVWIKEHPTSSIAGTGGGRADRLARIAALEHEVSLHQAAPNQEAVQRLELADVLSKNGAFSSARTHLLRAIEIARTSGDADLFGKAAIGLASTQLLPYADAKLPELLQEAIGRADAGSALHLELRAVREVANMALSDPSERCASVREIVSGSDGLEDVHGRARVLLLSQRALDGPGLAAERSELTERAFKAAHFAGEPRLQAAASHARLDDALAAGDIARFESELPVFRALALATDESLWLARSSLADSLLAHLRGSYDLALERRDHALSFLERDSEDHRAVLRATGFTIGRERTDQILEMAHTQPQTDWREPITYISMSLSLHYLGLRDAAERVFQFLPLDWSDTARSTRTWRSAIALYAEAAFLREQPRAARRIVPEMERCGNAMPSLDAFICLEPYAYFLGLAETACEAWGRADRHFRSASSRCRQMGARGFEARVSYAWAVMLHRQDLAEGRERARSRARAALETATELGMDRLERQASRLLDELSG